MIFQHPILFGGISFIPVIIAVYILIFSCGITPILFSYWKYGLFLIRSTILCTGSLNITFTSSAWVPGSWILKSLRGLDWKPPCLGWFVIRALPLFCCRLSSNLLYSSIRLMNCLISSGSLLVSEFHSLESSGNPNRKVLAAIYSVPPSISSYNS